MLEPCLDHTPSPQAISVVMDQDEDVRKTRASIEAGVEMAATQLVAYTKSWDEYVGICYM